MAKINGLTTTEYTLVEKFLRGDMKFGTLVSELSAGDYIEKSLSKAQRLLAEMGVDATELVKEYLDEFFGPKYGKRIHESFENRATRRNHETDEDPATGVPSYWVYEPEDKKDDAVNHPNHYNQYDGFEVIDVCNQLRSSDGSGNFARGNAFKYLARAGWKDQGSVTKEIEDLKKAKFYILCEIARLERSQELAEATLGMDEAPLPPMPVDAPLKPEHCETCHILMAVQQETDDKIIYECIYGHRTVAVAKPKVYAYRTKEQNNNSPIL